LQSEPSPAARSHFGETITAHRRAAACLTK
jgi:hypothetical protein